MLTIAPSIRKELGTYAVHLVHPYVLLGAVRSGDGIIPFIFRYIRGVSQGESKPESLVNATLHATVSIVARLTYFELNFKNDLRPLFSRHFVEGGADMASNLIPLLAVAHGNIDITQGILAKYLFNVAILTAKFAAVRAKDYLQQ